jgi:hypothetical protein
VKYAFLIYGDEKRQYRPGTPEGQKLMADFAAFTKEVQDAGVMVAGEALHDTPDATTVRVRGGQRLVTDGPFAETKEQLGGYYVLECKDLDEALSWAAKVPTAWGAEYDGAIEVRPVMVFE